ncbi:MAG: hypothetical protein H6624_18290 [Bdellovibrionaceae bacterium]|nr:hypothetical protein [Bdellovibrionales bacterium]MCB9086294.1 hypothetical protein [Pseudobdellovibrionaceae bacterium]
MKNHGLAVRSILGILCWFLSTSSLGKTVLGICDGEALKGRIEDFKEECRHCRPVMVDEIPRCLPHFMPGDVTSLTQDPLSSSIGFTLVRDTKLFGVEWPKGTQFKTSVLGADIGIATFKSQFKLKGIPVSQATFFSFQDVHLEYAEITEDCKISGYLWPKGFGLSFSPESVDPPKLWYVNLLQDLVLDGKKYRKGDYVWFNAKGKVDLSAPKPKPLQ